MAVSRREGGITDLQRQFIDEYLVDLAPSAAARRAGKAGTDGAVKVWASRTLDLPHVKAYLEECLAKRRERTELTQDWVLAKLVENVERSMQGVPVRDREGNETGEWKYEGAVANKALELLGKHLGTFNENVNIRTPDGPLVVSVTHRVVDPSAG